MLRQPAKSVYTLATRVKAGEDPSMRILPAILFTVVLLTSTHAFANVCDNAGGLSGKYLERCKRELDRCSSYRGKAVAPCQERAVNNAKTAQSRDASSASSRPASGGACLDESYTKACFELKERSDTLCKRSFLVRFGGYEEAAQQGEVDAWRTMLTSYAALAPDYAAFSSRYKECANTRGVRCSMSPNAPDACAEAKPAYIAGWKDYVEFFEKTRLPELDREVAKVKREKGATVTGFNKTMDRGAREGKHIAAINSEVAWIAVDQKRVDALTAKAAKLQAEVDAIYEARIAKVQCPQAKVNNAGLTSSLRKVTVDHLAGLEQRGTGIKETVVKFGLMGAARIVREHKVTHEDVPATTCVRQESTSRTACRIFNVTLRRTKPAGGTWAAWAFHSIGGGELMSCKNLR